MKKAQIIIDKYFLTGKVDKRISDLLLSSLDELFTREFIRKAVRCLTSRASVRMLWSW